MSDIDQASERVRRVAAGEPSVEVYGGGLSAAVQMVVDKSCICDAYLAQQPTYAALAAENERLKEHLRLSTGNCDRAVADLLEAESKLSNRDYCRCAHCGFVAKTRAECEAHFGDDSAFPALCAHWGQLDDQERISLYQELTLELNATRDREFELQTDNERLRKQVIEDPAALLAELKAIATEALELADEGISYASEYFQDKWQMPQRANALADRLAAIAARMGGGA